MTLDISVSTCLQPVQQKSIKLEVLDINNNIVDLIEGVCTGGSISIDSQSAIRRTGNLDFVLTDDLLIDESSPLWINKKIKVWAGIVNLLTGLTVWYNLGTYTISDPSININISDRTVSINLLDKMAMMDSTLSGQIGSKVIITAGTPISDAIKSTITTLGGETKYLIDTSPYTTPADIEEDIGVTIYDLCKQLSDLYLTWKIFYDVNSIFRFMEIKDGINSSVDFDFSNYNIIQSISQEINYSNVRNYYKIVGRLNDDATQYHKEVSITDALYPNSIFTIEKMGETRKFILQDDDLYTQAQVDSTCDYYIYKHLALAETISITCIPLLFLNVDMIIFVDESDYGITGKYLIDNIDLDLKFDGMMNIKAHKIYEGD